MSFRRKDNDALQLEEDSASAVTMVEGRKMHTTVSFMDWATKSHDYGGAKRKSLDLERMGSGVSCGDSSGSGEYVSRFSKNGFGNGKTANGHWLEQMQIHQRHDLVNLRAAADEAYLHRNPFESIKYAYVEEVQGKGRGGENSGGVDNKGSPGATGEEKSRRVHMFDKAVTPSDVGKLNRLVIPKHHAEKYFPLDTNEKDKGLLLTFQDSMGKEWRFRYSYWSSSQSYVLTKGWSRFVREMKLHAGDVVSFHRAVADTHNMQQQFFISWKRRAAKTPLLFSPFQTSPFEQANGRVGRTGKSPPRPPPSQWVSFASAMPMAAPLWAEQLSGRPPTEANWGRENPQFMKLMPVEQPPAENAAAVEEPHKRVRLFGVNL
ncbi:hypothetical protein SUGI_1185570 [Cryptomeria japonica]|uniref:B3 domain-containing protein Os03g0120900 n=1 Tax=Cryptomeria japonica TaxID=3369 RepID=UPI0024149193|nr:B3 domain-containing protein Os03g0120900 [Cryptomeria japonica]GLJ55251.1 hypothetical protein SUGI_1185570 [Cryptomeria japonica]